MHFSLQMLPPCRVASSTIMSLTFVVLLTIFLTTTTRAYIKADSTLSVGHLRRLVTKFIGPQLAKLFKRYEKIPLDGRFESSESSPRSFSSQDHHRHVSGLESVGSMSTHHYYHIGLDPINIMVSVSLLSLLFHTLETLLGRVGLKQPVVQARSDKWSDKDVVKMYDKIIEILKSVWTLTVVFTGGDCSSLV